MKAITCTQCGALIKRISRRDDFALCDYCGAKMLVEENKTPIVETSDKPETAAGKPLAPWDQYRENRRKTEERARQFDHLDNYAEETGSKHYPAIGALVIIGIAGILTFIFALSSNTCQSRLANLKEKTPVKTVASPEIKYPTPTPVPQINYEVKVQWDGNNDLEHFENPQIDMSKLPTSNVAELKKTVFKNRGV